MKHAYLAMLVLSAWVIARLFMTDGAGNGFPVAIGLQGFFLFWYVWKYI